MCWSPYYLRSEFTLSLQPFQHSVKKNLLSHRSLYVVSHIIQGTARDVESLPCWLQDKLEPPFVVIYAEYETLSSSYKYFTMQEYTRMKEGRTCESGAGTLREMFDLGVYLNRGKSAFDKKSPMRHKWIKSINTLQNACSGDTSQAVMYWCRTGLTVIITDLVMSWRVFLSIPVLCKLQPAHPLSTSVRHRLPAGRLDLGLQEELEWTREWFGSGGLVNNYLR